MVRSVGPSPDMNTATIVAVSFILLFFSPATLLLWNADALIKSQLQLYYHQICKVMDFSVLTCTTDIVSLPRVFAKRQEKSNLPMGVIIGTLSNSNKLRTLAQELIILKDMFLATHLEIVLSLTTVRQQRNLDTCESDSMLGLKGHLSMAARPMSFGVAEHHRSSGIL